MAGKRYWIKEAIKKKGSLKATTKRRYGDKAFTRRGTIKREYLEKMAKVKGVTGKRARLALTLRRLRRK